MVENRVLIPCSVCPSIYWCCSHLQCCEDSFRGIITRFVMEDDDPGTATSQDRH